MVSNKTETDYEIKLVFLGEDQAGKTHLVHKMLQNPPLSERANTPDVIQIKKLELPFCSIKLLMFDPMVKVLKSNNQSVMKNFFANCSGVFLIFDITNMKSLENLLVWKESLEKYTTPKTNRILVGTKADLSADKELSKEKILDIAKELSTNDIIITSAKTGLNVDFCLNAMLFSIIKK